MKESTGIVRYAFQTVYHEKTVSFVLVSIVFFALSIAHQLSFFTTAFTQCLMPVIKSFISNGRPYCFRTVSSSYYYSYIFTLLLHKGKMLNCLKSKLQYIMHLNLYIFSTTMKRILYQIFHLT